MQIVISAVGPDNRGLADPIIHHVTGLGANIAEIQMYDHDQQRVFAMLLRIELAAEKFASLKSALEAIGVEKQLSIRVWSPELRAGRPRLAICTTLRPEPALALLRAIRDKTISAEAAIMLGNRNHGRAIAEQFGIDWQMVGDDNGNVDDERLVRICDEYEVDYIVLARVHEGALARRGLEVRRRANHQFAPRPVAELSWHPAVSRRVREPNARLWRDLPLHRAGVGRRQSDHLSIDVHRAARCAIG